MRHIVIDQQGVSLDVEQGRLVARHASWAKPRTAPLAQLESVVIQTRTQLDSRLLSQLAAHDVRVQVIAGRGQGESCYMVGSQHKDARRRLAQYAVVTHPAAQYAWAKRLVRLRLRRQKLLLASAVLIRGDRAAMLRYRSGMIGRLATRLERQPNLAALRGSEGAAAALYFGAYQQLFAPAWGFVGRNRRPPRDPVNVLLSLAYTLLHGIVAKAVQHGGLDPQLGVLHEVAYGRDSLVCDLMEVLRSDVEWWVWRLCASETMRVEDFSMSDAAGHSPCTLGKAGRARFYQAFAAVQDAWMRDAVQMVRVLVRRLQPDVTLPWVDDDAP